MDHNPIAGILQANQRLKLYLARNFGLPTATHRVCMLSHFRHVRWFAALWTVACQAPCPWGSPHKNTGVGCHAVFTGSSPAGDRVCLSFISCTGGRVLYHERHLGSPCSLRPDFSSHSQPFPEKDLGLIPTRQRLTSNAQIAGTVSEDSFQPGKSREQLRSPEQ